MAAVYRHRVFVPHYSFPAAAPVLVREIAEHDPPISQYNEEMGCEPWITLARGFVRRCRGPGWVRERLKQKMGGPSH